MESVEGLSASTKEASTQGEDVDKIGREVEDTRQYESVHELRC